MGIAIAAEGVLSNIQQEQRYNKRAVRVTEAEEVEDAI